MVIEYNGVFYWFTKIPGESNKLFRQRCVAIIKGNNLISSMKDINNKIGCSY